MRDVISWGRVTRAHVLAAVREHDGLGREAFLAKHGFGSARKYTLIVDGRSYDSKAILGAAYGYATGRPLASTEFGGGVGPNGAVTVLRRLGFEIRGEDEPSGAPSPPAVASARRARTAQKAAPRLGNSADVILVGCVKSKLSVPAPARELYTSSLFRKRRAFAEATGKPWFILSALHGLVAPTRTLEPYDMYLAGQPHQYRRLWAARAVESLVAQLARPLAGLTIDVHAGRAYAEPLRPLLERQGVTVLTPLEGLTQGEQLAWYSHPSPPREAAMEDETIEAAAAVAVNALTGTSPEPAAAFPWGRSDLTQAGLYAWWVDATGANDLGVVAESPLTLAYAGQAGATRQPSGTTSSATLLSRIRSDHLGGSISSSTLRRTVAALLRRTLSLQLSEPGRLDNASEQRMTAWMKSHLYATVWPHDDRDRLGRIEDRVIATLDAPCNLRAVGPSELRARIAAGRSALGGNPGDESTRSDGDDP